MKLRPKPKNPFTVVPALKKRMPPVSSSWSVTPKRSCWRTPPHGVLAIHAVQIDDVRELRRAPWSGQHDVPSPSTRKGYEKVVLPFLPEKPSRPRTRLSCGELMRSSWLCFVYLSSLCNVAPAGRASPSLPHRDRRHHLPVSRCCRRTAWRSTQCVNLVVEVRIVRVVERRLDLAVEVVAGVHQVEIADAAFDREPGLPPLVVGVLLGETRDSIVTRTDRKSLMSSPQDPSLS